MGEAGEALETEEGDIVEGDEELVEGGAEDEELAEAEANEGELADSNDQDPDTMYYEGVVARYDAAAGRGFIECVEAKEQFGQDVYVHGTVLSNSGTNVGDTVRFRIHTNAKGLPQAQAPLEVLEIAQENAEAFKGEIKSYNENKGYGFVTCE